MNAIRSMRELCGLSQAECARRASKLSHRNISRALWHKWERTCPQFMLPTFLLICRVLEIKPAEMIEMVVRLEKL